jgi:hypothetical protein
MWAVVAGHFTSARLDDFINENSKGQQRPRLKLPAVTVATCRLG